MLQMVPSVRSANLSSSESISIAVPGPDGLPITGPAWVAPVVHTVAGHTPWLPVTFVDAGSKWSALPAGAAADTHQACIRVNAPEEAPLAPSTMPDSSYSMCIAPDGIDVTCKEPAGLVQALRTLGQLQDEDGRAPTGTIADEPAYPWRGIHLDVCRHFFAVPFLKKLLRVMAALGFNVFHWHLTEDQGWRLPVPAYPRLTEVGAYRTRPDGSRYGGFYTADEIRDVVSYAGTLGILVVPEVELPGHAVAAIASYPDLSCRKVPLPVSDNWSIHDDVFCAGNEDVFTFLGTVFDEVCRLFPSSIIHIGGDECPKTRWSECPACNALMKEKSIPDYEHLQSYFITRAAQMLAKRGRETMGWDEILEGGLPAGAMVMSWRGTEGGIAAANAGHRVVMTPTSHCYFDYRQTDGPDAIGFPYPDEDGVVPVTSVAKVYTYDPREGLEPGPAANVLGGQANAWSEELSSDEIAERMIAPRIIAMAEALWAAPEHRDFARFKPQAMAALPILDALGWRYAAVPELE